LAERWNGSRWILQRPDRPARASVAFLSGVSCPSSTSCTAVGFAVNRSGIGVPLAERWNGVRWMIEQTPSPQASVLFKLIGVSCTRQGPCTAAGFFSIVTGIEVMLAERWSGGRWAISWPRYPAGATGVQFAAVSCASPRACTAVGFFGDTAGFDQVLAERWDGTSWVIEPMPSPPGALGGSTTGVSCTSATTCTAVGSYITGAGGEVTLAERYS
jgi:hypothetical protein